MSSLAPPYFDHHDNPGAEHLWTPEVFETQVIGWEGIAFKATQVCGVWHVLYDHEQAQAGGTTFAVVQFGPGSPQTGPEPDFTPCWGCGGETPLFEQRRAALSFARHLARAADGEPMPTARLRDEFYQWLMVCEEELDNLGCEPDAIRLGTDWA